MPGTTIARLQALRLSLLALAVCLLALGGPARPAHAQGGTTVWVEIDLGHFILLSPEALEPELRAFAEQQGPALNAAYDLLAPLYGVTPALPINIRVYNSRFEFTRLNALTPPLAPDAYHTHLGAREIALIWPYPDDFLTTEAGPNAIRHELSGLLLSALSEGTMPAGLEIGFNQYAELPTADTERGVARLKDVVAGRNGRTLVAWRELFDSTRIYTDTAVAYPQALSIAAFLIQNYGYAPLHTLAAAMGSGQSYASAFAAVYGQPLDRLEEAWRASLPGFLEGGWEANALYNFDLSPYRAGLEAGAYAQVGQALPAVVDLLTVTGQTDKLTEAQELQTWAAEGVAAEDLVRQQREALAQGDYPQVVVLGDAAQAAFGALGDSRRVHEIQDALQRAQDVLDLRAAVAEAQALSATGQYDAAQAQLVGLIPQLEALGDTAGGLAARAALDDLLNARQAETAGQLDTGQRVLIAVIVAAGLIGVQAVLLLVRARRRPPSGDSVMVTKREVTAEQRAYEARLWWAVQPQWLWRLMRLTLRSAWVAALAAALGWLATRALGLSVPLLAWIAGGFALFMVLLPLVALWPVPLPALARRVDTSLGLADRVSTAREIAERAPQNYIEARLLTATHHLLGTVRARILRAPRVPWIDLELCLVAALALYGCYLLSGPTPPEPPVIAAPAYEGLPPLASDVTVPLPGEGVTTPASETAIDAAAAQQALQALIEALNAHTVTQPAGALLAQGDTRGSAQAIRGVADAADSLSAATRAGLSASLAEAAAQTRTLVPEASARILATAGALLSETPGVPAAGLEDLAQLIEDLEVARQPEGDSPDGGSGKDPGDDNGSGAGSGDTTERETQTDGTTERLEAESEPVDLPPDELPADDDSVLQPPDHTDNATDQTDTPYTHTGATGSGGDPASDPLSFPWRLRNVVQRYFSPR